MPLMYLPIYYASKEGSRLLVGEHQTSVGSCTVGILNQQGEPVQGGSVLGCASGSSGSLFVITVVEHLPVPLALTVVLGGSTASLRIVGSTRGTHPPRKSPI